MLHNLLLAGIIFPKMWRSGAKIKWRGAVVALMRWREHLDGKNGSVVKWSKDGKRGERCGAWR